MINKLGFLYFLNCKYFKGITFYDKWLKEHLVRQHAYHFNIVL